MKFSTYAAIVLLAASVMRPASAGASPSDESQLVMNITQQACDAIRAGDVPALEKLLAPDFTLVSSNADVQTREEVLAEVRNRDPRYEIFRNHSMSARVYANAAVVQGITSLKGVSGDKTFELDVRFTDTLIKEHGQWRLVVSHVTRLPAAN
jgi:ketosteroid isomerase-like protein